MRDNRRFTDVVRGVRDAERDVDTMLDAARLERHETNRMTGEQKMECFLWTLGAFTAIAFAFVMFGIPVLFG